MSLQRPFMIEQVGVAVFCFLLIFLLFWIIRAERLGGVAHAYVAVANCGVATAAPPSTLQRIAQLAHREDDSQLWRQ